MKIHIANDSKQGLGGGWSFIGNFIDGCQGFDVEFVPSIAESDVVFLPSSSMVKGETVDLAKALKKPIFLRIDNIPRNSRNRNTGTSRLLSYYREAKGVIFQSQWAKDFVGEWLNMEAHTDPQKALIYNGIRTDIFNPHGEKSAEQENVFLYSRINRDETKNWHIVWYEYQMIHRAWAKGDKETAPPELWLAGQFSPEQIEYGFDFFQGEVLRYWGVMEDPREYAKILRSAKYLLAPYYNDACSNSIIEAFACGVPVETFGYGHTGGTPELFRLNEAGFDWSNRRMAKEYIDFMSKNS